MLNRTLIKKIDLALSDLQASGGLMAPEQSKEFLTLATKASVLLSMCFVKPMSTPKFEIFTIRFGQRILVAASSATALAPADRSKPDLGKATLDVKLAKAEVRLDDETMEDNIEKGTLKDKVMAEMSKAVARDVEEVVIQGDTSSLDPTLALMDGILIQATSNIVDADNEHLYKGILRNMIRATPDEYLRDRTRLKFLTSIDAEADYRDSLADRATPRSDDKLEKHEPCFYSGIEVVGIPMFPENLGVASDTTNVVLTDPKNIWVGFHREIKLEVERMAREGVWAIIASVRFDVKYANEDEVTKAIKVKVAA